MKKLSVAVALIGSTMGAQAADLPVKATYRKAPASQAYDWTGFYVGANAGLGLGRNPTGNASLPTLFTASSYLGPLGAIGGAQMGYNWQFRDLLGFSNVVLGVETDIQGAGMNDNRACGYLCVGGAFLRFDQKLEWFGTARGRIGLATGPVLSYFTGGFAYGSVKTDSSVGFGVTGTGSVSETRTGWTIGSGVEAALGGNWTGKIEYLYLDLGTQTGAYAAGPTLNVFSSDIREHIFRAGVNYRIGGNGLYSATPAANWTGFYAGANGGTGTARNRTTATMSPGPASNETYNLSPDGYLGGLQAGYNWQAANWVFGIEADIQGSSQKDDRNCQLFCFQGGTQYLAIDQRLPWFGTVRGRLGYSIGSTLFYGTGGLAYGEVKNKLTEAIAGIPFSAEFKQTRVGYVVGAGIETPFELFGLFGKNWTSKTEYLYVDLGSTTDAYVYGGFNHTIDTKVQEHIFRTGLNYHFSSPLVAKY